MAELFSCYSPKGEKFELTKANYNDCINLFGFTIAPPGVVVEAAEDAEADADIDADEDAAAEDAEDAVDDAAAEDAAAEDAAAEDAAAEDAAAEDAAAEPLTFADKDEVKSYLRKQEIEFDGRASFEALVALANGE